MSDTGIAPPVAGLALSGIAAIRGFGLSPLGAAVKAAGVVPTSSGGAASPTVAWAGLAAGAVGAAYGPLGWVGARFTVTGSFGTNGALVLQGANSPSGPWVNLAAVTDPVLPGSALFNDGGLQVVALPNGVLVLGVTMTSFAYLRPVVQNGDAGTALSVSGNLSPTGCA
jgi:hypothetical protein